MLASQLGIWRSQSVAEKTGPNQWAGTAGVAAAFDLGGGVFVGGGGVPRQRGSDTELAVPCATDTSP